MKALETLLKVAQRRLDELGIEAANLMRRIEELKAGEAELRRREVSEVGAASADLFMSSMLPAYRQRMKQARFEEQKKIDEAEDTLKLVRERLSAAYQEKSRFEEMLSQQKERERIWRADLEQKALDEAALNLSNRRG